MTQLLISVKNVAEALMALDAGADIIDLKDPNIGALGALDEVICVQIVQAMNGRKLTSATVGEQHASLSELIASIEARAAIGVDIIKIAVSSLFYEDDFLVEVTKLSYSGIKITAVFFADEAMDLSLIASLQTAGFYGAMLDTRRKQGDLLAAQTQLQLQNFIALCEKYDLKSGLAGSLKPQYMDDLAKINPTYIGFRGGVCENSIRYANLSQNKVQQIANMLRQHNNLMLKAPKSFSLALHS
jgi:(5-formylfuran-3-yl)methyl phosphate synthase